MSQAHTAGGLPIVDAGTVWACDGDGAIEWKSVKRVKHAGSFETSVQVRCDGNRVELSGNVSRFGRQDNLFGFSALECVQRANAVLALYGLPPFTAGQRISRKHGRAIGQGKHVGETHGSFKPYTVTDYETGQKRIVDPRVQLLSDHTKSADAEFDGWTGARFSRLDLTANYVAGSDEAAHLVLQYLGSQHNGRQKGKAYPDGETVSWGEGKRARQMWKAYIKGTELLKHAKKGAEADQRVVDYCVANGVVRFEGTLRSNTLTELGAAFLGDHERGYAMGQLIELFEKQSAVMSRAERGTDDLDELPKHLRATARDYLAGMDCSAVMTRPTFYRHRLALLPFGIDLAMRNVSPFKPRVRVVELTRAVAPHWYQLAA